jgi:hypothetical protein
MSRSTLRKLFKYLAPALMALGLVVGQAGTAAACGGLVAPDGDVRLGRAATFVAWHDGVEHYLTSFTYEGDEANLGWIVPLPAIPTQIQDGGAWTLQRLFRETHPVVLDQRFFGAGEAPVAAAGVQVVQQVKVEALNITVLKGSGQAVLDWCAANGFPVAGETRAHLLKYAQGSPIFMAAKYDTSAVKARHQLQGDGAPVLITMPTQHIWVPLEVLALDGQQVQADLYLLTDHALNTSASAAVVGQSPVGSDLPGAPGFKVAFQERMTDSLFHDLSTDRNMGWVWRDSWLTYLSLDAPDESVTYDLGVSSTDLIRLAPYGTPPMAVASAPATRTFWDSLPHLPLGTPQVALALALALAVVAGGALLVWWTMTHPKAE